MNIKAQAAKNVSGTIRKIDEYNKKTISTKTIKINASNAISQVNTLLNKINSLPRTKTVTVKVGQSGSVPKINSRAYEPQGYSENVVQTYNLTPEVVSARNIDPSQISTYSDIIGENALSRATIKTPIAITGGDIYNSMKYNINLIKELENRIDSVSNSLTTLDSKMEKAIGKDKITYLQQQNTLYQEQLNLQKELEDKLIRQQNYYKYFLESKGVKFNADGNATNYEELLLKKEKELAALESKANKENATTSQKNAYESAKNALEDIKKYASAYFDVTFSELPKVREEWNNISNAIKENSESIKKLQREQELYTKNTKLREVNMLMDEINDKQDLLNEKINGSNGEERVKYQNEYIELLKEENRLREEAIKQFELSLSVYQKELSGFGITFDNNGTIKNLDEILNKYQHHESLEYLNELIEEYFSIQRDELPDARKEWESTKNEIDQTVESVKKLKEEIKELNEDSGYKSHNRDLHEVENALAINQIHLDNSTGKNYIEYLEQRIQLTHKLRKETQDLLEFENSRRNTLMSDLSKYGFEFRSDGSIINYGGEINALKESLSEEEFEKVFGMIEDYLDTTYDKIPELQQSLEKLGYSIEDYNDELEKLLRQRSLDVHLNKIKELENEYDKLSDTLSIVDIKLKHAVGKEKLDLLDEQIQLLEDQKDKQQELLAQYENMANIYRGDLVEFGIKFDENGDILNLDEVLNEYADHRDIEKLKELIDEYLDIQRDKIPDVQKEWESLSSTIKDVYKDQLNTAKKIEDEITSMYKKQIKDKIEALNKETDAKVKALKKQKDAYNKYREEVEYKNERSEKLDEINELQRQLDIAMRDTSLKGQQKVKELQDMLLKAQKELDVLTQNKIDSDINNMFDEESNRLEESNKETIEKLEELWSDTKIAEMVSQALGSGVFIDIEGNVHKLEDALIDFAEETGELFGVLGEVIKAEWITNLQVAQDAVKDLSKILAELDVNKISNLSVMGYEELNPLSRSVSRQENNINFSAPIIHIEGNVDRDVMGDLKSFGEQLKDDIYNTIVNKMM